MWIPLAAALVVDHTVIVPDLRGLGLSSRPSAGYDKKMQSRDVAGVMVALGVSRADLVTHDIGIWLVMPSPLDTLTGSLASYQSTRRFQEYSPGSRSFKIRACGTSASAALIWNAWSRAVSVFISTGSGTSSRSIPSASTRQSANTMRLAGISGM
jgi:pimeloyl-ACP methyl ester carboxylesterase